MHPSLGGSPHLGHSISLDTIEFEDGRPSFKADGSEYETASTATLPLINTRAFPHPLEYTPEHIPSSSNRPSRKWRRKCCCSIPPEKIPTGWRLGTTGAVVLTLVILITNVVITAVSAANKGDGMKKIAPIRTGDCSSIKKSGIGIHLFINIISTLLLGASNYCMQTISAPTRDEVNKAHAKGSWMDIGVPSVRNLRFIRKRRLFVWLCLGLSSIPLHLVYNSTFFVSTSNNLYRIWYADESFAKGASFNGTFFNNSGLWNIDPWTLQDQLENSNSYENLTNDECIKAYAKNLIEDRGDLVLIIDRPKDCSVIEYPSGYNVAINASDCGNTSETSLYGAMDYTNAFQPSTDGYITNWFSWICSQDGTYVTAGPTENYPLRPNETLCSDGAWKKQIGADPWVVTGVVVKYCFSKKIDSQCQLKVAINLLGVVIAFNIAKLIIMVIMARSDLINHDPLVTIGDAAASFIESPDPTTRGMCLKAKHDIIGNKRFQAVPATVYQPQRKRWSAAVSKTRWIVASVLTVLALAVILGLLGYASHKLNELFDRGGIKSLWAFGLGAINPYTLIQGWNIPSTGENAVISTVLITNLPQVLLSFWYLVINGVLTAMTSAAEWSRFAHNDHRPLRVSFPKGGQRSTYFLQLPYRYSIPLMAFSILTHWLVSQSIFIAQIFERTPGNDQYSDEMDADIDSVAVTTTAGFSPMGMILTCIVTVLVFTATAVLGRWRLRDGIPMAGSCSLAISAACHAPEETSNERQVKWGVVGFVDAGLDGIGHCSFSNDKVDLPEPGKLYS